jgi:hypothetical protein
MSGVVALLMFLALPGMFAGWFLGQWIGDSRRSWWIAVLAAAALTLVSAKLTALAIDWNADSSSAVGDAFTALFTAAGFWWNVVSVPLITLIGFGLARSE